MEYWVDGPCRQEFKSVGYQGYLFDNFEGTMTFGGEFCCLVGESEVLSFKPYLLIDTILCWGCGLCCFVEHMYGCCSVLSEGGLPVFSHCVICFWGDGFSSGWGVS